MNNGFELTQERVVHEIQSRARLWRHVRSGAEFLSVENEDENKVFGIAFRTPPPDSSGVIHVLEHATLQGSRRYSIKSPIQALLKGSMRTYVNMNAFPDKTVYPVASRNVKDLYNLIDVFMDGVFYARLSRETFMQEGWHFELGSLDDPLTINGIVYNEQKGNLSMAFKRIAVESQKALFPDTVYGHAYGGSPDEIPNLTYEQFKSYYYAFYHPANARIFWYGDDHPEERLRYLDSWLREFEYQIIDSEVPLQPAFERPRAVTIPYYAGDKWDANSPKGIVTLNWVLPEVGEPQSMIAAQVLAHLLVGTPASPLRASLMDSGLGNELAGLGLYSHARQMYFSTGLQGIRARDFPQVQNLILDTLTALVQKPIDPAVVAAALNSVEFELREAKVGPLPRGLVLMQERALTTWIHGHDPLALLAFEAPLTDIKDRISGGEPYFETLIQTWFIENTHRATVCLKPDPDSSPETGLRTRLDAIKASQSTAELERIVKDTQALVLHQQQVDRPEDLARIPCLELADLDWQAKVMPGSIERVNGCQTLYTPHATHGILYVDLAFDLHALPQELLPYVPIFGELLINLDGSGQPPGFRSRLIGQTTGGIDSSLLISGRVDGNHSIARLVLRGKALQQTAHDLFEILTQILQGACFDDQRRVTQLVTRSRAQLEARLAPLGYQFITRRIGAAYSESGWLSEHLTGVEQLFFLRRLERQVADSWEETIAKLDQIRDRLLSRRALVCSLTASADALTDLTSEFESFVATIPDGPVATHKWFPDFDKGNHGLTIPSPVNFVGKGACLYDLGYVLDGSVDAIANFINMNWLFEQIRVQGGAYGGRCTFDPFSGMFVYESYRDPHVTRSLNVYDRTCSFLHDLSLAESERIRSIIGALSRIDMHQAPDAVGHTALRRLLTSESDQWRQSRRDELFGTRSRDFHDFADVLAQVRDQGRVVVMGSPEAIGGAQAEFQGRLDIVQAV